MRTEREQQVIEAAYNVFFRYGYGRTTMADLASAAKLSRPALYLVYPGKAEVFQAVVEWIAETTLAAIQESLQEEWPLDKKLVHALELAIVKTYDAIKANPDADDLLSLKHEVPALEASYAKLQAYLGELIADAVERSGFGVAPQEVARTLLSAMRGFKVVANDADDLRQLMTTQVALVAAALDKKAAPRKAPAKSRRRETRGARG
jgi:AcrR family transcriptional regulator